MVARRKRFDLPPNPAAVVRALRACRDAMVDVSRSVKPNGPAHKAASGIMGAIDILAGLLTGDREYFWDQGSAGGGVDLREKLARESGQKPWQ